MKIKFLISFILFPMFSMHMEAQEINLKNLSVDEINFINYYIKDDTTFNKYNTENKKIGYWIYLDSLNHISKIVTYSDRNSNYEKIGDIISVFKRTIVYGDSLFDVDILFDNIYSKSDNTNKLSGPIGEIEAYYKRKSMYFNLDNGQTIKIKKDTAFILSKCIKLPKKQSSYLLKNEDILLSYSGAICSCSSYHDIIIIKDNNKLKIANLFEIQYFERGDSIYLFSYQNCNNRLRIYRIKYNAGN